MKNKFNFYLILVVRNICLSRSLSTFWRMKTPPSPPHTFSANDVFQTIFVVSGFKVSTESAASHQLILKSQFTQSTADGEKVGKTLQTPLCPETFASHQASFIRLTRTKSSVLLLWRSTQGRCINPLLNAPTGGQRGGGSRLTSAAVKHLSASQESRCSMCWFRLHVWPARH